MRLSSTVRVVIVDDHPLLLEGTRAALEQALGIDVVGVCTDGATALQLVRTLDPDVILLDILLPDKSGIDVAREVRATAPHVAVVALTGHDDPEYPRAFQRLGARGFLRKNLSGMEIADAVRAVAAGEVRIPTELAAPL